MKKKFNGKNNKDRVLFNNSSVQFFEYSTFNKSSYRLEEINNLPSSKCISRFSSKLFNTGKTFLSAFSIPSKISILPSKAALTALCKINVIT